MKEKRNPVRDKHEEYFAKMVIEHEFNIIDLQKSESPDWVNETTGIEVVTAFPVSYSRAESEYIKGLQLQNEGNYEKAQVNFNKSYCNGSGLKYYKQEVMVGGHPIEIRFGSYCGDSYSRDIALAKERIEKKIKKSEQYKAVIDLRLYVFILGGFPDFLDYQFMQEIQNFLYKKSDPTFSEIYIHAYWCWKLYHITPTERNLYRLDSKFYNEKLRDLNK